MSIIQINVSNSLHLATTAETLRKFAPHKLSELCDQAVPFAAGKVEIFVDQDPRLFPYILRYLRSGHEHASFIETELTKNEQWQLYEEVRDYYHIDPLLKQLKHKFFPVADPEQAQIWTKKVMGWYEMYKELMSPLVPGFDWIEEKEMEGILHKAYSDPLLFDSEKQFQEVDATLEELETSNVRYNRTQKVTQSIAKVFMKVASSLVGPSMRWWQKGQKKPTAQESEQSEQAEQSEQPEPAVQPIPSHPRSQEERNRAIEQLLNRCRDSSMLQEMTDE